MKLWVTHPTGNTFVRALLDGLGRADHDFDFFTTLGFRTHPLFPKRRSYSIEQRRLHWHPVLEMARLLGLGVSIDAVYEKLDRQVAQKLREANRKPEAVYAYEDGARETFETAREEGVQRFYELPIAYWETTRRLLSEEAERLPEWERTLLSTSDCDTKLARKTEELALADCVICPSQFVFDSVPGEIRMQKRCVISHFGSPPAPVLPRSNSKGRLRLLFAGSMTQRKGLADVFEAMRLLKRSDVELHVMGALLAPLSFYRSQFPHFIYERPRNHEAVLNLMLRCDVLVLPSIVEGRALVQQEGLACGLPLIVTRNAGGEDLVDTEITGFLVPPRSPQAIADRINWFASNRNLLEEMRPACRRKAASYSWRSYAERILGSLNDPVHA